MTSGHVGYPRPRTFKLVERTERSDVVRFVRRESVLESALSFTITFPNGNQIVCHRSRLLVGRSPECDVMLGDKELSRRHFVIARVDFAYVLFDLDSTNGTFVNHRPVMTALILPPRATIEAGRTTLAFAVVGGPDPISWTVLMS